MLEKGSILRNGTRVLSAIGNITGLGSKRGVLASTTITILLFSVAVGAIGTTYLYGSSMNSEPPQVQITSLADDEVLATGLIELRGTTANQNGEIQAISIKVDGGAPNPVVPKSVNNFSEWTAMLPISSPGNHTIEVEAADSLGKTWSTRLSVVVKDAESVIVVPPDQTVEATGPSGALVDYQLPTVLKDVRILADPDCLPDSGSVFPIGTTTVTCVASYVGGTVSASFMVNVRDTVPPSMTVPADVVVTNPGLAFAKITIGNTLVKDVVDENPEVSNNAPTNGFGLGTTEVVWTATDDYGNTATATQKVTVTAAASKDEGGSSTNDSSERRSSVTYSSGGSGGSSSKSGSSDSKNDDKKGGNGVGSGSTDKGNGSINTKDNTSPMAVITSPANGAEVTTGTHAVQGTASDNSGGSGVSSVQIRLDGGAYVTATPKATGDWSTWTASVDITIAGSHTIHARVTDKAGNYRDSSIALTAKDDSITKDEDTATAEDTTGPSVAILQPEAGSTVTITNGHVLISGTASDIENGVSTVEVRVDDGDYVEATPAAPGDWSVWSITVPITAGEHRLVPRATDNAGNHAWNSISVAFTEPAVEDTADPVVEITNPADGSALSLDGSTIEIQGTASDSGSGIDVVDVRVDDGEYLAATPKAAGDWSTWSISMPIAEGERRIVPRATDNAGNHAWNSIYVTIRGSDQPVQEAPELPQDDIPDPLRTVRVSSIGELMNAIGSAKPGDHIVVEDGVYDTTDWLSDNSAKTLHVRARGTVASPIVIMAETIGGAEIKGRAGFGFDGAAYLIVRGFKFSHSQDNSGGQAIRCDECSNVRFTRNHFALTSSENDESDWLGITSKNSEYNRIDHNTFENKETRGNFIYLIGSDGAMTQHNRIDHNHFYRHTYSSGNGGECITMGHSAYGTSSAHTTVEYNLFEECNGDAEIVSVKSSNNVIRANTFRNSDGSVVLRHGNENTIDGNFFVDGESGIRVYGHDHVIVNNYFEGNTAGGVRQPIIIGTGTIKEDLTTSNAGYSQPQNVVVAHNTLVDNSYHMVIGYGSGDLPPLNTKIAYNIIVGDSRDLVTYGSGQGTTWQGNILFGDASAGDIPGSGYEWTDPRLVQSDGVYKIASSSPAINTAGTDYSSYITSDMDGQRRSGDFDAGADEYSTSTVIHHPLQRSDVGTNST